MLLVGAEINRQIEVAAGELRLAGISSLPSCEAPSQAKPRPDSAGISFKQVQK
jgi:hypothetical protein